MSVLSQEKNLLFCLGKLVIRGARFLYGVSHKVITLLVMV